LNRLASSWLLTFGNGIHLPRLKDLDGLDTRFLAPAAGFALGQRTASHPFSVAAGRDALGPELARRVRSKVDHDAVRVDVAHASALVQLVVLVDSLELDAHAAPLNDCRDMVATPAAPRSMTGSRPLASQSWEASSPTNGHETAGSAGKLLRFLVALLPVPDLLLCAKHLFVGATVAIVPARAGQR
jgi:hypothetical protein